MIPDPRTQSNPVLTQASLQCLVRGLRLSVEERADVARACRKLSAGPGTVSSQFSTYCNRRAPSLALLERLVKPDNAEADEKLNEREIVSCRHFVDALRAVGLRDQREFDPPRSNAYRPGLHQWGSMGAILPRPSVGNGYW